MSRHGDGLRAWLIQRVSALYLALFTVYLVLHFWWHPAPDYLAWREWLSRPLVSVGFAGFVLALLAHSWVGLRDIVLDYIHPLGLRLSLLTAIAFVLIACGFWAMRILILAST